MSYVAPGWICFECEEWATSKERCYKLCKCKDKKLDVEEGKD